MVSFVISLLLSSQVCFLAAAQATDDAEARIVRKAPQGGRVVMSVSPHGDFDTIEETPLKEEDAAILMDQNVNDLVLEVEGMVQSGTTPSQGKIKVIHDIVMNELLPDLKKTRDASEAQVHVNLQSIVTCNNNSQTTQQTIKSSTEVSVGSGRTSHSSCRADEKTKEGIKDAKCGELDNFLNAIQVPADMPNGKPRAQMVPYVKDMSNYFCPKGPTVTELDNACKKAEGEHGKQRTECHKQQATFESGFCTWRTQIVDACMELDTCYDSSVKTYNHHVGNTKKLVQKWKVEFAALNKIVCYTNVWQADGTVTADQLSKCQTTTVDTSPMDIHYPAVPAKISCDLTPVKNHPGTDAFATNEYSAFAKYVNKVVACLPCHTGASDTPTYDVTVGPIITPAPTPAPPPAACSPPEASAYQEVLAVNIPDGLGNWDEHHQVPYTLKKSVPTKISRVAYCLKLNDDWVWTSFDLTNRSQVGVPVDYVLDGATSNLNVVSGSKDVQSTSNTQGKLEFWSHCYGRGATGQYDGQDVKTRSDCYGSMQVHADQKTVWAFNGWSFKGYCDVQIGNQKNRFGTDGTFNRNCNQFANGKGTLHTFVKP